MATYTCDFLNHARLSEAPALRALAVDAVLDLALSCAARFRIQYDRARLASVLGPVVLHALFPDPPVQSSRLARLECADEPLNDERARLLRTVVLWRRKKPWAEEPLNYITTIKFFDGQGKVLVRANDCDGAEFILFDLPPDKRKQLAEYYQSKVIPLDAIESVDININWDA